MIAAGRAIGLLALPALLAALAPAAAEAATFTVTNNDDSGVGSLREAIGLANGNNNPGEADEIGFAFPGAPGQTITVESQLPLIEEPTTIDGCLGVSPAPTDPCVGLRASDVDAGDFSGLVALGDLVTVRRLAITNMLSAVTGNTANIGLSVRQSRLGVGLDGTAEGNVNGVSHFGLGAQIGGGGLGNVIANNETGVLLRGSFASVTGNQFGTFGPNTNAVLIEAGAENNTVGGNTAASENVVSNSNGAAILIRDDGTDDNIVLRNTGNGNVSLFADLSPPIGPGNNPASGPNDGIQAPAITAGTNAAISGTGAHPSATVRVYRRAADELGRIDGFVGGTIATAAGTWQLTFPGLSGSGFLVATQSTTAAGTSELSSSIPFAAPPPPPPPALAPPPALSPPVTAADNRCSKLRKKLKRAKRQDKDKKARKLRRKLRRLGCRR